jgi:diguanylate cyclase (GGDEF)-like protein
MHALWDRLAVSLKARVFILTVGIFVAVAAPAYVAFEWFVRSTVVTLGRLFAEKQILFDRYRGLEALMREVSLAETVARSPAVLDWARAESDGDKAARGLAELEHYRLSFRDRSYFLVVHGSGNYYFNDRDDHYAGRQLRYAVKADNPRDGWYFTTIAAGHGCHLNVDRDDSLAVTKVWVNCVIADGERTLGVIGTGVDLSEFIHEVVALPQTGVTSMFVDMAGAIQAHRDPRLVDFHSLTKDTKSKKTIFRQVDTAADAARLAAMMTRVSSGSSTVESQFMRIAGREVLVGVGYLDRLGWYNVTLMDIETIIDRRLFTPIAVLLAAMMAAAAALVTLLFRRSVLDRLAALEASARRVEQGDYATVMVDSGGDEIGRLSRVFAAMATAVQNYTGALEEMVGERTAKLRRLADMDLLTEVPNRRGFISAFERMHADAAVTGATPGLLLIDLDGFKDVNDGRGHLAGDRLLAETAQRLSSLLGIADVCARWGGDEFVVLLADCDEDGLRDVCVRMLGTVNANPIPCEDGSDVAVTISIGACRVAPDDTLDAAVARADAALYAAKRGGRNRFVAAASLARPVERRVSVDSSGVF